MKVDDNMRIGIDIDGVLTNIDQFILDYISKYCIENNIEYHIDDVDYDYSKTFGVDSDIGEEFWFKNVWFYAKNENPRPFVQEILRKLKDEGHEIYIITARRFTNRNDELGIRMRQMVKDWLSIHEIPYDKLIFSIADKEEKTKEIIDNKIDLMIEDNPNNIDRLANIIPVICYDARYNKTCIGNNIIRCYSWYDIYYKINKLLFEKKEETEEDF